MPKKRKSDGQTRMEEQEETVQEIDAIVVFPEDLVEVVPIGSPQKVTFSVSLVDTLEAESRQTSDFLQSMLDTSSNQFE